MNWRETPRERLLSYHSVLEWKDKERTPEHIDESMSDADRKLFIGQCNDLRQKLWNEHYDSLPQEIRRLFETKEHPRFHSYRELWELRGEGAAKKYLLELQLHLQSMGRRGRFRVVDSAFDDVRLGALLDPPPLREELYGVLPNFFMGFEVVYYPPECGFMFNDVE